MNLHAVSPTVFRLSLQIGCVATLGCTIVGVPAAWWIARSRAVASGIISAAVLLPLVLPPTAIGYYVLYALGRQSPLGRFLIDTAHIRLVFTWQGASIAAAIVSLPLFVRTAQAGFEQIDESVFDVARTLSSDRRAFFRIALPMAWPSLVAATLIAFARSVGEFGAVLIVAGNIPGRTQTVPTAIYDAVQAGNTGLANTLAVLIVLGGLVVLGALAFVLQRAR